MQARPATAAALILCLATYCTHREDPWTALQSAAAASPRTFAGRLWSFAWTKHDISKERNRRLRGAANDVLAEARKTPTAETLHRAGAAHLLIGDTGAAISTLEKSLELQPSNAAAWSDLAAAIHATNAPQRWSRALAAADRAIDLAPSLAEAHFNRATILQSLGLLSFARQEAEAYRKLDRNSRWAAESLLLGRPKPARIPPGKFEDVLFPALAAARKGDMTPLRLTVDASPRDARGWADSPLMAEWGQAVLQGDEALARQKLDDVRNVGLLLQQRGNRIIADVVTHVEKLTGEARLRHARASVDYFHARTSLHEHDNAVAERELRRVAELWRTIGSPMARRARYYAAIGAFEQNDIDSARAELESLEREVDARRHPSFAAEIDWQVGLAAARHGHWSVALQRFERASATFRRLDEQQFDAFMQVVISEIHDHLGEFDKAWSLRVDALERLSNMTVTPPAAAIAGAIRADLTRKEYEGALALSKIAVSGAGADAPVRTLALANHAHVLLFARGPEDALRAAAEARRSANGIADPETRALEEANIALVEGRVLSQVDPWIAVDSLGQSIAYYESRRNAMFLPAAHLARGRAFRAMGDIESARYDLERALEGHETQRQNVSSEQRLAVFDLAADAIDELIDVDLQSNRPDRAFATVERVRARTLAERLMPSDRGNAALNAIRAALPPRSVLVEYAILRDRLILFAIDASGLSAHAIAISEKDLKAQTTAWVDALRNEAPIADVERRSARMFDLLVRPIATRLAQVETIVFVPDRFLCAAPFAALLRRESKRYLVEDQRIVVSPNATLLTRSKNEIAFKSGLVIGDPTAIGDPDRLAAARREAEAVARIHRAGPPLMGELATASRFRERAPQSSWIHYAGHTRGVATEWLLPLASPGERYAGLAAADIARLDLNRTRLVVLAACSTLRGRADRIEGMPSLSRAFLAAGAGTVIGTLWDVDDQHSARFFRMFHERLRDGASPSTALQGVQRDFLRDTTMRFRHPAAWAAVQQLGLD